MKLPSLTFALVLAAGGPAAAAQYLQSYGKASDFLAAAGTVVQEDFDDSALIAGFTLSGARLTYGNGEAHDFTTYAHPTTLTFAMPIRALGLDLFLDNRSITTPEFVLHFVDGTTANLTGSGLRTSFLGFTSNLGVSSIDIRPAARTLTLGYAPRHGYIARATTAAVPEPHTWMLLIGGFGLAGSAIRRRRNSLVA